MMSDLKAVLSSKVAPTNDQIKRFEKFVSEKYGDIPFEFVVDESLSGGFVLKVGDTVYDWTREGRFEQLKAQISALTSTDNIIPLIRDTVENWTPKALADETGYVISVGDGIATVKGLKGTTYGEILLFDGGVRGMAQNLDENGIGCILFDDDDIVKEGSVVKRSNRIAGIPVGENFLGRVVNALGMPIDGKGEILADGYRAIESPAPRIVDRQSVDTPLATGILSIDSMFPIGRGQRELIIGDRQTGKTAIAIDTIINQKGKDVICIYVAIGQKASSVASLVSQLEKHGALDYTVVVCATASDSAPLQYVAPYAGCSIGEYFMERGQDVLIVYDDLSKHAVAYRSLSLLLGRSPGREAYPGDVFYLHSRLLERAARLSDDKGGGSITALPIVETQAGDVASYIPTNVISITDGQIFLESDLFMSGQRPAVNIGLSVSRVGGDAQTKAMKSATGTLRLDLAQYRELKVFMQFASELDDATKEQLDYGKGLMKLLCQKQYHPYALHEQIILLVTAMSKVISSVDYDRITEFASELLDYYHANYNNICVRIDSTKKLTEQDKTEIAKISAKFLSEKFGK